MDHDVIQLFDQESSTFTYFLVCRHSREAIAIDSVDRQVERDLALVQRLDLRLHYVLETHAHADHITGAGKLREMTGAKAAAPSGCGIASANVQLEDGDVLLFGVAQAVTALHTPGHTAGSMSFLWQGNVFTGDTLLIDGCGRTDFQSGDAGALYDSVHAKLFALPPGTRVYPAHDYHGNCVSTIGWEQRHNSRLAGRDRAAFVALMEELHLPKPKMIDVAVPANQRLGIPHAA